MYYYDSLHILDRFSPVSLLTADKNTFCKRFMDTCITNSTLFIMGGGGI